MTWYEVLVGLLGVFGGGAGLISIYQAKSNKQTIDIGNMQTMLDEAHKMYEELKEEKESVNKEFHDYKAETMKYIAEFKARFKNMEERLDRTDNKVLNLQRSIYQGYRCRYPEKIEDCPVLKEYEKFKCNLCDNKE